MSGGTLQLKIGATGMVTPVGLSSAATCAALRAGVSRFGELPVRYPLWGSLIGARVPTFAALGLPRLAKLLVPAVRECLAGVPPAEREGVPLLLSVSEPSRPGRPPGLEKQLVEVLSRRLRVTFDPKRSAAFAEGRTGVLRALARARELLWGGEARRCIVAGVDSYLGTPPLAALRRAGRLKLDDNPDGLIPGEAAAALEVLPPPPRSGDGSPRTAGVIGLGFGGESSTVTSGEPNLATGLTAAIRQALSEAATRAVDVDFRLSDLTGEQYFFKETANALLRTLREHKESFPIWHPADCIGDTGAAAGAVLLALAASAYRKGYAVGPLSLCQCSGDGETRAAAVLRAVA